MRLGEALPLRVNALVHPPDGLVLDLRAVAEELGRLVVEAAEVVVDRRPLCADVTPVNAWPERRTPESPEPQRRRAGLSTMPWGRAINRGKSKARSTPSRTKSSTARRPRAE